ncbi:MAG TPA: undecaprenyldiphospho-muramoylpentapeptide beta-N-acetylglucosaminyltransferase [Actinomycetota bacterium]|nr:undecaprenyldiphospho-muramoylpentapeptide beta-N-acetylglucosaminyltransferase [Actinomycetota bacterium]
MKIVIAGGGTAGHVNPALALARALDRDDVVFVGTIEGLEARLVTAAGFDFETIDVVGFDRAAPGSFPKVAARALGAIRRSRAILSRVRPDVVIGMGGYVSLPVALAAASRGTPLVLHEQNIVLGLAHKTTKPFARRVAVSFEETLTAVRKKGVLTGNPVDADVASLDRAGARTAASARFGLDPEIATVLAFGGSLGARTINQGVMELARLWRDRPDRQILHITGRSPATQVEHDGMVDSPRYKSLEFVEPMADAYAAADVAVARGGASTLAEITAVGLPALIVPYPHHRDRQQTRHGQVLEHAGAGIVVPDDAVAGPRLAAELDRMLEPARLDAMATASRALGRPDAAQRLAAVVRESAA